MLKKSTKYKFSNLVYPLFLSVFLVGGNVLAMDEGANLPMEKKSSNISVPKRTIIEAWKAFEDRQKSLTQMGFVRRSNMPYPIVGEIKVDGVTYELWGRISGEEGEKFLSDEKSNDFIEFSSYDCYSPKRWGYKTHKVIYDSTGAPIRFDSRILLDLKPIES